MNTPSHLVVNLLILGRKDQQASTLPVLLGAGLPDAPMFIFYIYARFVQHLPEHSIWRHAYFDAGWQAVINIGHSFPLIGIALLVALWWKQSWWIYLFSSMMLHSVFDLPLHHLDAHKHFFPFSDWRFISPVSYWDPRYYGHIAAPIEAMTVIIICIVLWQRYNKNAVRWGVACIGSLNIIYLGYIFNIPSFIPHSG